MENVFCNAKRGLKRMGYIRNMKTYGNQLREIIADNFDFQELYAFVDNEIDNGNVFFYNKRFEPVTRNSEEKTYEIVSTGYRANETGETVYAGFYFYKGQWTGVFIGTQKSIFEQWNEEMSEDNFYNNIYFKNWEAISNIMSLLLKEEQSSEKVKEYVEEIFKKSSKAGKIYTLESETKKRKLYFFSGLCSNDGEKIWFYSEANAKEDAVCRWYGLYCVKESELWRQFFDMKFFNLSGLVFDGIYSANLFLNKLAEKAIPENWVGLTPKKGSYDLPVLKGYIENTYSRLCNEAVNKCGKIVDENGCRYFNTGLLDRFYRQIIIRGKIKSVTVHADGLGEHEFGYIDELGAFSENEPEIAMMFNSDSLPKLASYLKNYHDAMFDTSIEIKLHDAHVFEDGVRRGRIPSYTAKYEECKNDKKKYSDLLAEIARDFDAAVKRTVIIAKRNYKLAIPQYIKETDEIQYMLPIYLGSIKSMPDCILSLKLENSGSVAYYRGTTILTPEMAFNNARLISGPELYWISCSRAA